MVRQSNVECDQLYKAYAKDSELYAKVIKAVENQPSLMPLMLDVAAYILSSQQSLETDPLVPPSKRRKLNGDIDVSESKLAADNRPSDEHMSSKWHNLLRIPDVSFSIPQRKKLSLEIGAERREGIRAVNPKTGSNEFFVPWTEIEHIVCLPVPEKVTAAYNFCVFPKYGDGITSALDQIPIYEPIVWTINETKGKDLNADPLSLREQIIEHLEKRQMNVLEPSLSEFVSETPQAQRKGERAYHVKAFRGSKDGYLFFLSTGVLWGFKKPLYFFSFDHISTISYTSVLHRTFNLNISTDSSKNDNPQEYEFSMIDQADFAGIDSYVKRHQLQDASMAAERKAKKLNINGAKADKDLGNEDGDGETELEKAAREAEGQAMDDEDEEDDENFDPGSEGESEGSGSSSEEEDVERGIEEEEEENGDSGEEDLQSEAKAEKDL